MQTTTTITETRTKTRTTCDRCGRPCGYDAETIRDEREMTDRTRTVRCQLRAKRFVKIELDDTVLADFAEGGDATHIEVDCCDQCFVDFVLPALEAIGFSPRRTEISF